MRNLIREQLLEILQASERAPARVAEPPAVVLVVGVNGAGKTTTIGKLAHRFKLGKRAKSLSLPITPGRGTMLLHLTVTTDGVATPFAALVTR